MHIYYQNANTSLYTYYPNIYTQYVCRNAWKSSNRITIVHLWNYKQTRCPKSTEINLVTHSFSKYLLLQTRQWAVSPWTLHISLLWVLEVLCLICIFISPQLPPSCPNLLCSHISSWGWQRQWSIPLAWVHKAQRHTSHQALLERNFQHLNNLTLRSITLRSHWLDHSICTVFHRIFLFGC